MVSFWLKDIASFREFIITVMEKDNVIMLLCKSSYSFKTFVRRVITNVTFLSRDIETVHCVKGVQIQSFFLVCIFRIRIEYGEILCISPYSVRMLENRDQEKLLIWTLFRKWLLCRSCNLNKNAIKSMFPKFMCSWERSVRFS